MSRPAEEPVTKVNDRADQTEESHPAYALIGASRVTCGPVGTPLFGSDFRHNHYVRIHVSHAVMNRSLSHDWPNDRRGIVEVELSEAQWATFVSSLNCGLGVPCTLRSVDQRAVPGLPDPPDRQAQFNAELGQHLEDVKRLAQVAQDQVAAAQMRVKDKAAIQETLTRLLMQAGPNTRFVAKSFGEHVERTVERAKVEISAWMHALVFRSGIAALRSAPPPIALPGEVSAPSTQEPQQ